MLRIAHRGGKPENSMAGIASVEADLIEIDLRRTKDGVIVLIHDDTIDRTTDGTGKVSDLTLKEVKSFKLENDDVIPTFEDVLSRDVLWKLDIKEPGFEAELMDILEKHAVRAVITSEHDEILEKVRSLNPSIVLEAGGTDEPTLSKDVVARAKRVDAKIISPEFNIITQEMVDDAHAADLEVHVWTVNEKVDIERMRSMGVDAITSDNIELV